MDPESKDEDPIVWRGTICLSLAIAFEVNRARFGLPAAIDRLRDSLDYHGLTLDGDELLFAGVLDGSVSSEQLTESLCCSVQRVGLSRH